MSSMRRAQIAELAASQLGLVTTAQLMELGLTSKQRFGLVQSGWLDRIARNVHVIAGAPTSPHQRLLAATLSAGDGAVASHLTAAWLWGFDGLSPRGIELSVPRARRPRTERAVVHRVSDLLPVDVVRLGPQPLTTPARTILDIAAVVTTRELEEALDGARRRGQVYLPFLQWRFSELRRNGRAGVAALDLLLAREQTSARAESWLESAFLRIIRDAFLPPPRVQVVKRDSGRQMRLDAFYDDQRLVAEVGGHGSHATRRQRQADAERRARLVALGLRVVDFTHEDVRERPPYIATTLGDLLRIRPYLGGLTA